MIWESHPWKHRIAQKAASLRRRASQRRWPLSSLPLLEEEVFVGAYAIRKLLEARKLSDEVESLRVPVETFPATGVTVDLMNWDKIDLLYDLTRPGRDSLSLQDFVNQMIHSFVFMRSVTDEGGLAGLFFTSDRQRRKRLSLVTLEDLVSVFDQVASDDIVSGSMERNPASGEIDWVFKSNHKSTFGIVAGEMVDLHQLDTE